MTHVAFGFAVSLALALPTAPAAAQSFAPQTVKQDFGHRTLEARPFSRGGFPGDHGRGDRRSRGNAVIIDNGWYNGGEWALYNNRSWESDSYNDWWHDNPQRAYPRWMQNNQECQRVWWSGSGWRC